jgi:hypothetical protein
MLRYAARRLLSAVPVLLLVSMMAFAIVWIVPGDVAAEMAGPTATAEEADGRRTTLAVKDATVGTARSLPAGYVKCADEWGQTSCNFTGSAVLYYGASTSYYYKTVTGPFNCNTGNSVLGDPISGVSKACYIPSTPAPAPAPAPAPHRTSPAPPHDKAAPPPANTHCAETTPTPASSTARQTPQYQSPSSDLPRTDAAASTSPPSSPPAHPCPPMPCCCMRSRLLRCTTCSAWPTAKATTSPLKC